MARRIALVGTLVVGLLGVPRTGHAGLLDLIWEMSGPQMLGLGYGCYFAKGMKVDHCRFGGATLALREQQQKALEDPSKTQDTLKDRVALGFGGSIFGSTGKDSSTQGYDLGEIWMLAIEPGVAVRINNPLKGKPQFSYGGGISYDVLFGRDIKRFDKFAFTITPIDVAWDHVAIGVKLRLYPNGFTDDEFKPGPRISQNRPFETSLGFTFAYIIRRCPC
jgi:hypothetical protein